MPSREGRAIISLVNGERFEEALGLEIGASARDINTALVRLTAKFQGEPEVREALATARGKLIGEASGAKGARFKRIGRDKEALPLLRQAVKDRGSGDDYHWLGVTLWELRRKDEALTYLEKALKHRGDPIDNHWFGTCLWLHRDTCEYERLSTVFTPELRDKLSGDPWAAALAVRGPGRRSVTAVEYAFRQAVKEVARSCLRAAVDRRGDGIDHYWLGLVLWHGGGDENRTKALSHLHEAVKRRGATADFEALGMALLERGEPRRIAAFLALALTSPAALPVVLRALWSWCDVILWFATLSALLGVRLFAKP